MLFTETSGQFSPLSCCCAIPRERPRRVSSMAGAKRKRLLCVLHEGIDESRHLGLMMMPSLGRFFPFLFFLIYSARYAAKQQSSSTCWLFDRPHLLLLRLALLCFVPL